MKQSSHAQVRSARQLILSVGLGFWGLGAAVSAWGAARSPQVDVIDAVIWALLSGVMLAAFIADVGRRSLLTGQRRPSSDPLAEAWSGLLVYPIIPATTVAFVLDDVGVLGTQGRNLVMVSVFAGLVFARGLTMLSPVGRRMVAVDARRAVGVDTARWLAPLAGSAFVLTAALTVVAAAAQRPMLATGIVAVGFVAVHAGLAAVARRAAGSETSDGSPADSTERIDAPR